VKLEKGEGTPDYYKPGKLTVHECMDYLPIT